MGNGTGKLLIKRIARRVMRAVMQLEHLEAYVQQEDSGGNIIARVDATIERSDNGMSIAFPFIASGGSGTSNPQVFGGNGPPTATTLPAGNYVSGVNPNCYVDKTNQAFWYCATAGTASTSKWTQLTQSALTPYTISSIQDTNLTCASAVTGTGSFTIYKPGELSGALGSEVIDGETITYSGYTDSFNERTAQDPTGNQELQYVTPRYVVGATIWAMPTLINAGGWTVQLMEISPSRQWGGIN